MSGGEILKCQFCELKFSSTYKIIPHTFFGHKKKISKMVAKQAEIRILCPCAPSGCPFVQTQPVEKSSSQEEIFRLLATALLGVESHVNTLHTGEPRLTSCPYCALVLDNIIYWEHLQEHMATNSAGGGANSSGVSPVKALPGVEHAPATACTAPVQPQLPEKELPSKTAPATVETTEEPLAASAPLIEDHSKVVRTTDETKMLLPAVELQEPKQQKGTNDMNIALAAEARQAPNAGQQVTASPSSEGLGAEPAKKVDKPDSLEQLPDSPLRKGESLVQEPSDSSNQEYPASTGSGKNVPALNHPSTLTEQLTVKHTDSESNTQSRDEGVGAISPVIGTLKAPEELAADTIPFKVRNFPLDWVDRELHFFFFFFFT
jgi:hypothetical protein